MYDIHDSYYTYIAFFSQGCWSWYTCNLVEEQKLAYIANETYTCNDLRDILDTILYEDKDGILYISDCNRFTDDLLCYLKEDGYYFTENRTKKKMKKGSFNTLISYRSTGRTLYHITIKGKNGHYYRIYNLFNIINGDPIDVCNSFGLSLENDMSLGMVEDYENVKYALPCYAYAHAIDILNLKVENLLGTKMRKIPMTISSYASRVCSHLTYRKALTSLTRFEDKYPDIVNYFSNTFHGGIVYKRENADNIKDMYILDGDVTFINGVNVYDYTSLYPSCMKLPLPFGEMIYQKGCPSKDDFELTRKRKLCMTLRILVDFKLKEGMPAFIHDNNYPIMDRNMGATLPEAILNGCKYSNSKDGIITDTQGHYVELTLNYPDYYCFLLCCSVRRIKFLDYFICIGKNDIFNKYIDKFFLAKRSSSGSARDINKRLLNVIYGSLCKNKINYNYNETEEGESQIITSENANSYIHIGSYVASWARFKFITGSWNTDIGYGDTDSYHIPANGKQPQQHIGNELGELKLEASYTMGYYFKKKCYILLNEYTDDNSIEAKIVKAGTDKSSVRFVEKLINNLSYIDEEERVYDVLYAVEDFYKEALIEGFDKTKYSEYLIKLWDIVRKRKFERLKYMYIPVRYKVKDRPFHYKYVLRWEKFVNSPLDEYM